MIKEFPEVFMKIQNILDNQEFYYLDTKEYCNGERVNNRHPLIRIDKFWFMKFGQYYQNDEYILFHVSILFAKDVIGVLKFSNGKLEFYKIGKENDIRDFNITLLDELYNEFTVPFLNKLEKIKNGIKD